MQVSDSILICSDNAQRLEKLVTILEFIGESVEQVTQLREVTERIKQQGNFRSVIYDGELVDLSADFFAQHATQAMLIVGDCDKAFIEQIPNLIGCIDFPFSYAQLTQELHNCQDFCNKRPGSTVNAGSSSMLFRSLVGRSENIQDVRVLIEQVATTDANVLVLGESGTGKEVVARNVHYYSKRREGPFIPVNCGAIPPELLESELFGHEKGAFTGAFTARKGRFELAQGGTLFLDEIGDMPQPMQVKLLRVLQERTFERVGGNKTLNCDVRIVAATHQHLETRIKEGKFREDLFYRLNVFPIDMPALRERKGDIPLLLQELVTRMETAYNTSIRFTQRCMESLMMHDWLGNVRELSNLVERLVILYPNNLIDVNDLPAKYRHLDVPEFQPDYPEEQQEQDAFAAIFSGEEEIEIPEKTLLTELPAEGVNLKEMLSELEIDLIGQALEQQDYVVSRAAEVLGMRRTTLVEKMRKYGMSKDG
ncbi:sigma-54 dependent transcriptional regulator [Psychrobium sp. 1_MG-2023]|uniref:sigma-54 dependent transcriptional regulator n=1 Tax=Psychrobium sp. 1_MG-2023 TaxID=3062624 RepID=UPI000C33D0E1|nr:sigma-54 dependent transcriptional regulator [Psychrobium sp. 1_MG-2023]MDP2559842.1 sigma-54 dependent transcriptional regulator [Psychrobium sp. 1_MG-2023]PKF59054.1 sigma-54-dependent Fis family transcriptional regulator [Alteromonadales bacterium alter-6D02]